VLRQEPGEGVAPMTRRFEIIRDIAVILMALWIIFK
jgi:hypothetical protein